MVKTGSLKSSDMMQYSHMTGKITEVLEGLLRSPVVESQSLAQKPGLRSWSWGGCYLQHAPPPPASSGHQDVSSSWPGPPSLQPSPVSFFLSLACAASLHLSSALRHFQSLCSMDGRISWCSGGGEKGVLWVAPSKGLTRVPGQN